MAIFNSYVSLPEGNQAFFGCEDQLKYGWWMWMVNDWWIVGNMLEICGNMEYVWKWIWKILMKYPPTIQSPSIDDPAHFSKVGTIATMGDQNSSGMISSDIPTYTKRCVFFLLQPSSLFRPSWNWEWRPSSEHGVSSAPHHWALAWTEASMRLMWEVIMRTEDIIYIDR